MSFLDTAVRPHAPAAASASGFTAPANRRRLVAFAVLHIVLLGAMYGAAYLNAKGHELEADAYGAGRVEHMGRMTLYPVVATQAMP